MEFEEDFYTALERIQESTDLIPKEDDIRDLYGIMRSGRRGATAHAMNMNIPADDINAFNRWGTELSAQTSGRKPRLDMLKTYAAYKAIRPSLLRFSRSY